MSSSTACYQGHVVQLKVVLLWSSKVFGNQYNTKEFRVLNPHMIKHTGIQFQSWHSQH